MEPITESAARAMHRTDEWDMCPREVARQIEWEHRPWWIAWYGTHTRRYWALALWVPGPAGVLEAGTPAALVAQINDFEKHHPKPR